MAILKVLLLICLIKETIGYPGVILQHPVSQTKEPGVNVKYVCAAQGDVVWYINDRWLSYSYEQELESGGFSFHEVGIAGSQYPRINMTITVTVSADVNETKFQCRTAGSDGNLVSSKVAWLWVAGPPLPPNVSLQLVNWSAIQPLWDAPFTMSVFPILKYTVHTTISNTGNQTQIDREPPSNEDHVVHTIQETTENCHQLQFEVFAINSVGASAPGTASGGFPVAVRGIPVNTSVVFLLPDLTPQVNIRLKLPDICVHSQVFAEYTIEVTSSSVSLISRLTERYQQSTCVEESLVLEAEMYYTVNSSVFVPTYAELGSATTVNHFHTFLIIPTEDSTTTVDSIATIVETSIAEVSLTSTLSELIMDPIMSFQSQESKFVDVSSSKSVLEPNTTTEADEDVKAFWGLTAAGVGAVLLLTVCTGIGINIACVLRQTKKTVHSRCIRGAGKMISGGDLKYYDSGVNERDRHSMAPIPLYEAAGCPTYDVIPEHHDSNSLQKQGSVSSCSSNTSSSQQHNKPLVPPNTRERDGILNSAFTISEKSVMKGGENDGDYDTPAVPRKEPEDCYVDMQSRKM